jgi:1-deoxy-D-xylulose-5-phosphate synthase
VLEFMAAHGYKNELRMMGIPDAIVEHGTPKELYRECHYDAEAIRLAVLEMMREKVTVSQFG